MDDTTSYDENTTTDTEEVLAVAERVVVSVIGLGAEINSNDDIFQNTTTNGNNGFVGSSLTLQHCQRCGIMCEDPEFCPCRATRCAGATSTMNSSGAATSSKCKRMYLVTTILYCLLLLLLLSTIIAIILVRLSPAIEEDWKIRNKGEVQRIITTGSEEAPRRHSERIKYPWIKNNTIRSYLYPNVRIVSDKGNDDLEIFQVVSNAGGEDSRNTCPKTEYKEFFKQEFRQLRDYQGEEKVFPISLMANATLNVWLRVLSGSVTVQVRNHLNSHHPERLVLFSSVSHHDQYNEFTFQAPSTGTYDLVYIYNVPFSVVNTEIVRNEYRKTYVLQKDWEPTCNKHALGLSNKGCLLRIEKGCILVMALNGQVNVHIQYKRSWSFILMISLLISCFLLPCWLIIIGWSKFTKSGEWKLSATLPLAKPMDVYAYLGSGSRNTLCTYSDIASLSSPDVTDERVPLVVENTTQQTQKSSGFGSYNSFTIVLPEECISVES